MVIWSRFPIEKNRDRVRLHTLKFKAYVCWCMRMLCVEIFMLLVARPLVCWENERKIVCTFFGWIFFFEIFFFLQNARTHSNSEKRMKKKMLSQRLIPTCTRYFHYSNSLELACKGDTWATKFNTLYGLLLAYSNVMKTPRHLYESMLDVGWWHVNTHSIIVRTV